MSHIYIIYIYISVQCLSPRDPQRLKKPLENGVLVTFPFQLRVLGWRSGGSQLPRQILGPLLLGSLFLLGKPRQKWEQQGFGIVHRPCGI